jgi:ATP phosphoribosyltransferase
LKKQREEALTALAGLIDPRIIEVRGEDVPYWLESFKKKGKPAIGLTGQDLYEEYRSNNGPRTNLQVIKTIEWKDETAKFGKPALCLIGPKGEKLEDMPKDLSIWIASKYRGLADKYLEQFENKGYSFQKNYVNGCVETSCSEGIADLIIDIVYTGSSLKRYGLDIYDTILKSDFLILGQGGDTDE